MPLSKLKKTLLAVPGALILGAFGSGLWELGVRPGGSWLMKAIFTFVTFGSKVLMDKVYLEASKGNHEGIAISLTNIVLNTWLFSVGFYVVRLSLKLEAAKRSMDEITQGTGKPSQPQDRAALIQKANSLSRTTGRLRFVIYALTLIMAGLFMTEIFKGIAANGAYTYFDQSFKICRPYMTDGEAQMIESKYASIRTRDEYMQVINGLQRIADEKKLRLPDTKPW